jgi:hypothetical protein
MGVGYYKNMTLWNNGTDPFGCTSIQDDLGMITTYNGFTYRTDDHSNSNGGSTVLSFTSGQTIASGIIERATDADVFKINMPVDGIFHLEALPYSVGSSNNGSNLDIQVQILRNQTVIGTYNPSALLNATIDTMLDAGNYFLKVQAMGNLYAPQYASLGSYSLAASYSATTPLPLRQLKLSGKSSNGRHQLSWLIDADEQVVSQVLELSGNARDYTAIGTLSNEARQYINESPRNPVSYYRLHVTLDNGKDYYSNTIAIRDGAVQPKPQLVNNPVHTTLMVNSPEAMTLYHSRLQWPSSYGR